MYSHLWKVSLALLFLSVLVGCGNPAPTTLQAKPCATVVTTSGLKTFRIVPDKTQVSYHVSELVFGHTSLDTHIGTTHTIQGGFVLRQANTSTITSLTMMVDLRTLATDDTGRDEEIRQRWLESNKHPIASFTSSKTTQVLSHTYQDGQDVTFKITGDMTLHGVTRPATFDVQGKLLNDTVTGTAKAFIHMKDFGVTAPAVVGVATVQDGMSVVVNFTAQQSNCAL